MKKAPRNITLTVNEPWNIECDYTFGGFILKFQSREKNGQQRIVKIVLHFCDVSYLAGKLWEVITQRRKKVEDMEKAMRGIDAS